jgi:hypothetical protein
VALFEADRVAQSGHRIISISALQGIHASSCPGTALPSLASVLLDSGHRLSDAGVPTEDCLKSRVDGDAGS